MPPNTQLEFFLFIGYETEEFKGHVVAAVTVACTPYADGSDADAEGCEVAGPTGATGSTGDTATP